MQQIRFDFLTGVNGGNNRSSTANAHASEQSGDAFARILDRQMTRRGDDAIKSRAADPRNRSEASDRADNPRPQTAKRRDAKSTASTPAHEKPEAKLAPKAKQPQKTAADNTTCAKPATKPETDETDQTAEAAAGTQATTENTASTSTTETEGQSDTTSDPNQQQPDDGTQQQTGDATDQADTVAASTDLSLVAMLAVPLPLQTLSAETGAAVDGSALAAGGNAATALQAELAARLAGSIDLSTAVSAKAPGQAATGGLKFGAILHAGGADMQQAASDAVAALQDAAEELAKADPLAPRTPEANGKTKDSATTPGGKARETAQDKAAATVTPELNAKTAASIVQPSARAAAVTWSGTTSVRNELAEGMAMQASGSFAADDAEFSNWSQYLGAGAHGLSNNIAAKQSAFMAQLKANLQNLPPQEQIAVHIKDAMQNGNSRLTVALHPVELGRVEVKLDIDKDKNVTATIVVDRPATLDLLRNDAKALERALQDAGLQTDSGSLSFNLRDSNGQNGGAQNGSGTGTGSGLGTGGSGSEVKAEVRADVVKTADGYVDLET
jgi:flagellar hook-length control protein FliK